MNPNPRRPWWLRKRSLLPLLFLLGLAFALVAAIARSDTSRIIVYNETGVPIGALRVTACGQETVLQNLDDDESYRWKLAKTGMPGEIGMETASNPPWRWHGGYIKPHGGYRVIISLMPDGEVELQNQISVWQRFLYYVSQQ